MASVALSKANGGEREGECTSMASEVEGVGLRRRAETLSNQLTGRIG